MATQLTLFFFRILPFLTFWSILLFKPSLFNSLPWLIKQRIQLLIYSPLVLFASLGIYAVLTVIYGVATFNDCKKARESLIKEVAEAKEDLRKRGIFK
uniref:Dolichol-phosphate mannosyltransferase subunit 3 n=1 Tax=Meloidogyne hapla TaxID=6305 RepID=A0A1I8BQP4_MELHA